MKFLLLLLLVPVFVIPAFADSQQLPTDKGTLLVKVETDPEKPLADEQTKLKIAFINPKTNQIQEHVDYKVTITNGGKAVFGPIPLTHTAIGTGTIPANLGSGQNEMKIDIEGIVFNPIPPESVTFTVFATDKASTPPQPKSGCLIATATQGSELAPQVQMLRELRDNVLLRTQSGTTFMGGFNEFYYSFSPTVADWERQNLLFKETVKATIAPMLVTLSILQFVHVNSEFGMLGYGIGVILLNIGMYFVAPTIMIVKIKKYLKIKHK